MRATKNLEEDHVHILKLTEVMEMVSSMENPVPDHVERIIGLIRNFADGLHHAKEENLLFPLMIKKGFSAQNGPVAVMLADHSQGREYVKTMTEGVSMLREGNPQGIQLIRSGMVGYIELLRNHIAKENNVLFRMADQVISDEEDKVLMEEFKRIDYKVVGDTYSPEHVSRINELTEIYLNTKK